jgi:hypothetical protein
LGKFIASILGLTAVLAVTLAFPGLKVALTIAILTVMAFVVYRNKQYELIAPMIGGGSNFLAMMVNGGTMPVRMANFVLDPTHHAMTAATHLKLLCDIIPVGQYVVLSLGDVILFTWGLTIFALWVYNRYKKVGNAGAL